MSISARCALGLAIIYLAAAISGCACMDQKRCTGVPPGAEKPPRASDVQAVAAATRAMRCGEFDTQFRRAPLVDIHAHGFNARDLPIRGILLSRLSSTLRGKEEPVVNAIADLIVERSDLEAVEESALLGVVRAEIASQEVLGDLPPTQRAMVENDEDYKAFKDLLGDPAFLSERAADPDTITRMAETDRIDPWRLEKYGVIGQPAMLGQLISRRSTAPRRYREAFDLSRRDAILVFHMMDLAPVYDQTEEGWWLRDFVTDQVPSAEAIQDRANGRLLHFVAYNPYRDHWRGWPPAGDGKALEIVREAIEDHGMYGVKVYPPSGYRANGNQIPDRPTTRGGSALRQWEARYTDSAGNELTGSDFDNRILKLLDWCVTNDIPVFAHCSTGEFEAQRGYGRMMAHPSFWKSYLELPRGPGEPDRSTLRLCLGHAGSSGYWFGTGLDEDWGQIVHELCVKYRNVYCEVGVHDEIRHEDRQAYFAGHLADLFARDAHRGPDEFEFSKKILYGTDWFMPISMPPQEYLARYEAVFLTDALRRHYHDFFRHNALEFLNVQGEASRDRVPRPIIDALLQASGWSPDPERGPTPR